MAKVTVDDKRAEAQAKALLNGLRLEAQPNGRKPEHQPPNQDGSERPSGSQKRGSETPLLLS